MENKVITFEIFADIHVRGTDQTNAVSEAWITALKDIEENFPETAALLIAGDNSAGGKVEQLEGFYEILREYGPKDVEKYMISMGNHDARGGNLSLWNSDPAIETPYWSTARRLYMEYNGLYMPDGCGTVYYDRWISGYHFIVMNTENAIKDACSLTKAQLKWLEEKISENEEADRPVFVINHQALDDSHWRSNVLNGFGEEDWQVKEILARHPQVVLMSGHIHNGFGICGRLYRPFATLVDIPSFSASENGVMDIGCGYHVEICKEKVTFRARNYVQSCWMPEYDFTIALPAWPVRYADLIQKKGQYACMDEAEWNKEKERLGAILEQEYDQSVIESWDDARPPKAVIRQEELD